MSQLLLKIRITISEPWEFESLFGKASVDGLVVGENHEKLLVKLLEPVNLNKTLTFMVVTPRYKESLTSLCKKTSIQVTLIGLSEEEAQSSNPYSELLFHSGNGFIGSIELI